MEPSVIFAQDLFIVAQSKITEQKLVDQLKALHEADPNPSLLLMDIAVVSPSPLLKVSRFWNL